MNSDLNHPEEETREDMKKISIGHREYSEAQEQQRVQGGVVLYVN